MKFGAWQKLPWKLAALSHWCCEVRSAGARAAIKLWDASIAEGYAASMHHPLSAKFLDKNDMTSLRVYVDELATVGTVHPDLAMHATLFKFIPVVERAPWAMILT